MIFYGIKYHTDYIPLPTRLSINWVRTYVWSHKIITFETEYYVRRTYVQCTGRTYVLNQCTPYIFVVFGDEIRNESQG